MKQWLDFIPLLLFFIAFKILGIFPATLVLLVATLVVYGGIWIATRHLDRNQVITVVATLVFGGITLLLHDVTYLKWKATVINWIFAVIFLGSHFIGTRVMIEHMLGHAITAPAAVWRKLNVAWTIFFICSGALNLYVAFTWSMDNWLSFKVFGNLGITLLFVVAQTFYLRPYLQREDSSVPD